MDGSGREASHQGITAGGEGLLLLAERAVYWPRTGTIHIADAHFGKAASFRARGVPVPEATTTDNLDALGRLVERWSPRRIVFLGDFTHAREADSEPTRGALCAWRRRYSSPELILVRGNHDALESGLTAALDMRTEDEPWQQGGLALCHHPQAVCGAYVVAGHLHPAYRLTGRANERARLPCFWFAARTGILPAFGAFTGGALVRPGRGDRIYLVGPQRVHPVPP